MPKKSDATITPENFLDSYKPVSPQRRNVEGDATAQTEQQPMERSTISSEREAQTSALPRRQNGVVKGREEYIATFLKPNFGESMRYGKTYYVSLDDVKKFKTLMKCFGDKWESFPLSVYIHNVLEHHFEQFADFIRQMMNCREIENPFNPNNESK